jgi:hypothetical protein
MSDLGHYLAGRVAAANRPNIVTFCRCGLGFFGQDVSEADKRFEEHMLKVS